VRQQRRRRRPIVAMDNHIRVGWQGIRIAQHERTGDRLCFEI